MLTALTPDPSPIRWARGTGRRGSCVRQRIRLGSAEGKEAFEAIATRGVGRDFRAAAWAGRLRCHVTSHLQSGSSNREIKTPESRKIWAREGTHLFGESAEFSNSVHFSVFRVVRGSNCS